MDLHICERYEAYLRILTSQPKCPFAHLFTIRESLALMYTQARLFEHALDIYDVLNADLRTRIQRLKKKLWNRRIHDQDIQQDTTNHKDNHRDNDRPDQKDEKTMAQREETPSFDPILVFGTPHPTPQVPLAAEKSDPCLSLPLSLSSSAFSLRSPWFVGLRQRLHRMGR